MKSAVGLSLPATRRPPTSAKPAPLRSGAWTARPNRRDNQVTRRFSSAAHISTGRLTSPAYSACVSAAWRANVVGVPPRSSVTSRRYQPDARPSNSVAAAAKYGAKRRHRADPCGIRAASSNAGGIGSESHGSSASRSAEFCCRISAMRAAIASSFASACSTSAARGDGSAPSTYAFKSASVIGSGFIRRPRSLDDLQRRWLAGCPLDDAAELFARTRQSRHHGPHRDRQHGGYLFVAHFLNRCEHENCALIHREPSDFTQDLHQFDPRLLHRAYGYLPCCITVFVAVDRNVLR